MKYHHCLKKLSFVFILTLLALPLKTVFAENLSDRHAKLSSLAHEVTYFAKRAHEHAEENVQYQSPAISRALGDLHTLQERAEHFQAQVESSSLEYIHTRQDYDTVVNAYATASRTLPVLNACVHVQKDFNRAGTLLTEMNVLFQIIQDASLPSVAHRMDDLARELHEDAESTPRRSPQEIQALRELHAVAESARHFHEQVESYKQDPFHTYQDYLNLANSYAPALRSFGFLNLCLSSQKSFDELRTLIGQLNSFYINADLRRLVHQADALATSIHLRAEAAARPRLPMEIQALQNLHILAESAKYFHEQVERNFQAPSSYAQQEYTNLYNSYVQARRTWAWVSSNQVLQKDFDQLATLIRQLQLYFKVDPHPVPPVQPVVPPSPPVPPVLPVPPTPPHRG